MQIFNQKSIQLALDQISVKGLDIDKMREKHEQRNRSNKNKSSGLFLTFFFRCVSKVSTFLHHSSCLRAGVVTSREREGRGLASRRGGYVLTVMVRSWSSKVTVTAVQVAASDNNGRRKRD